MLSSSSEPNKTLSFFSLPAPPDPPGMLTPPLHTSASVPFRWEEAPGKPRACNDAVQQTNDKIKTSARRCLELPPRLSVPDHHHPHQSRHARITNMPSPITVLDGPDVGRSLSYRVSFLSFRSPESLVKSSFGSSRWGSFRKVDNIEVRDDFGSEVESFDNYKVMNKSKVRRRRRSLLSVSSSKSHLWGSIYESLKQAVPWNRIRNKMGK